MHNDMIFYEEESEEAIGEETNHANKLLEINH